MKNPDVNVSGVKVLETVTRKGLPGWTVLLTTINLSYKKKKIDIPEPMFIKNGLITGSLFRLKDGYSYRDNIKPHVQDDMYNDAHLLFGNKNAKHKLVVFSDPMCPFCRKIVPDIMKAVKKHPNRIALYYYHMPLLQLHPVSGALTAIMHEAQKEGKTDVVEKMYTIGIDAKETDLKKIIAAVKKHTGYEITEEKLKSKELFEAMKTDMDVSMKMMVGGTPAIYVDGEWDREKDKYKRLIK
ncbi:MAG: thioredoxin domain-containing protein [Sulfurovum sp.]|nr:thioredoxin domain-containing protein [Sulfurovum sp.]